MLSASFNCSLGRSLRNAGLSIRSMYMQFAVAHARHSFRKAIAYNSRVNHGVGQLFIVASRRGLIFFGEPRFLLSARAVRVSMRRRIDESITGSSPRITGYRRLCERFASVSRFATLPDIAGNCKRRDRGVSSSSAYQFSLGARSVLTFYSSNYFGNEQVSLESY